MLVASRRWSSDLGDDGDLSAAATHYFSAEDGADELEQIAAWTRARILRSPDARLLVMLPGAPSQRQRLVH